MQNCSKRYILLVLETVCFICFCFYFVSVDCYSPYSSFFVCVLTILNGLWLFRTWWWFKESNERWETHYYWGKFVCESSIRLDYILANTFVFNIGRVITGKTFRSKHILNEWWEQNSIKWSREEQQRNKLFERSNLGQKSRGKFFKHERNRQ